MDIVTIYSAIRVSADVAKATYNTASYFWKLEQRIQNLENANYMHRQKRRPKKKTKFKVAA